MHFVIITQVLCLGGERDCRGGGGVEHGYDLLAGGGHQKTRQEKQEVKTGKNGWS